MAICARSASPRFVAQLQTAWVIFGKHRWVSSGARRSRVPSRNLSRRAELDTRPAFLAGVGQYPFELRKRVQRPTMRADVHWHLRGITQKPPHVSVNVFLSCH